MYTLAFSFKYPLPLN